MGGYPLGSIYAVELKLIQGPLKSMIQEYLCFGGRLRVNTITDAVVFIYLFF